LAKSHFHGVERRVQSVRQPGQYARKLRAHDVEFGVRSSAIDCGLRGPQEVSLGARKFLLRLE
jgi:hypothetical protein